MTYAGIAYDWKIACEETEAALRRGRDYLVGGDSFAAYRVLQSDPDLTPEPGRRVINAQYRERAIGLGTVFGATRLLVGAGLNEHAIAGIERVLAGQAFAPGQGSSAPGADHPDLAAEQAARTIIATGERVFAGKGATT